MLLIQLNRSVLVTVLYFILNAYSQYTTNPLCSRTFFKYTICDHISFEFVLVLITLVSWWPEFRRELRRT